DPETGEFLPGGLEVALARVGFRQVDFLLGRVSDFETLVVGVVEGADPVPAVLEGGPAAGLEAGQKSFFRATLLDVNQLGRAGLPGDCPQRHGQNDGQASHESY